MLGFLASASIMVEISLVVFALCSVCVAKLEDAVANISTQVGRV